MKTKIQKLLTILLVLPIFVGAFYSFAVAEVCESKEQCQDWIDFKTEEFQDLDKLYKSYSFCLESCGLWEYSDWEKCKVSYDDEDQLCSDIAILAEVETDDEPDYVKRKEKLNELKTIIGAEILELKRIKNGLEGVKVDEVLSIKGQEQAEDLEGFLGKSIDLLVGMVGLVAFIFLVVGGFRLLAAAGNDNEIQKAKTMLTYSIIGLAVALLAYIIVATVQGILYS